jgi:hypothetical protein
MDAVARALFVPELALGIDALQPADRARLCAYLSRVAEARGSVLHTNIAWNALYYGWNPDGGYETYGVDLDDWPSLRHGEAIEATPVGALCWVQAGTDLLWGEVIHKEGRHRAVDEFGELPSAVSGRRMETTSGAILTEALTVDFDAFGPDERRPVELERYARHARYLDAAGHVVVDAIYPREEAELDDVTYYARWLWRMQRDRLRGGWLGACLEDPGDDEALWAALVGSLRTVDALLDETPGLAAWGAYRYPEAGYRARIADRDTPLGGADASWLTMSLASPPSGGRVAYRTLRHRLLDLCRPEETGLRFAAYPLAVCHANRMVADTLAEAAPDGILTRAGERVHLRLDDAWQSAGIWRVEHLDGSSICPLLGVNPTVPLGLGASGEAADVHVTVAVPPSSKETAAPHEETDHAAVVTDSHVHWCVGLRPGAHRDGILPIPADAGLVDGEALVRLAHDGDISDDERVQAVRVAGGGRRLEGLAWPFDFFPGIRLWCIAVPGGRVVHVATAPLAEPIKVDRTDYQFAFDLGVLDPGRPGGGREATMADLAVRVLRRHGEPTGDGRVGLDAEGLTRLLFGPDTDDAVRAALARALMDAEAAGRVKGTNGRYTIGPARQGPARPKGGLFGGVDAPTRSGTERLAAGVRRAHWVVLHLRRLSVSPMASPDRRAQYRELWQSAPNRHLLPRELPDGYTFVDEHRRGR